jgi:hypothetical protein
MWRNFVSITLLLVLSGGWVLGDATTKKTVQELRAEIKQLRALEKTQLQEITAWYDRWIAQLKGPEQKLEEIRAALRVEEKKALKNASTAEEKKLIRKRYQEVNKILSGDIKVDKQVIHQFQQQKKEEEKLLRASFVAKIKELEAAINLLEKSGSGKPKG